MNQKKIVIVFTGGTIGSKSTSDIINVSRDGAAELLVQYERECGPDVVFEILNPYDILSENCTLKTWEVLNHSFSNLDFGAYDGVIITHGTDTLSYTAALLGLLYGHSPVPVILISSNYPLEDRRSNGYANFRSAVFYIKKGGAKGVFSIYRNSRGENVIYLSTRLVESEPYGDQFFSFGGNALGTVGEEGFLYQACPENPSLAEMKQNMEPVLKKPIIFQKEILLIRPYPGLNYDAINLDTHPAAVLHYMYHSATACVEGEKTSILRFLERCREKGIPVYGASFKSREDYYKTSKDMLDKGLIPLSNISPEAAYAKLVLAYNQKEMMPEAYMERNICFETITLAR